MDILFVVPGNAVGVYQGLAQSLTAVETPTWTLMLAESCRSKGYSVGIIDANAERLVPEVIAERVRNISPRIVVMVVYGQNVNSGTTSMSGAVRASAKIKELIPESFIVFVGSYVQALPKKALLDEDSIDAVCTNEGVISLHELLKLKNFSSNELQNVSGIAFRVADQILFGKSPKVVPEEDLESYLPGYAWDLLPKNESFLDLYRSPLWHANYMEEFRSPYAAIQTSLGCNFGCKFCMINTINRNDNAEIGVASNYRAMRYFGVDKVVNEIKYLMGRGVRTIRIVDEMFLLNKRHYLPLCEQLEKLNSDDSLRLWAYSRIDTVANKDNLNLLRRAGFRWLCLGIESGVKNVRLEVSKGKFEDVNIKDIVASVQDAGIEVLANYMFGLPLDTKESMQETLDLSMELNTLGWNGYPSMPLPGSELYSECVERNVQLPPDYEGYSFHSYSCRPCGTISLSPAQVLEFRDMAHIAYHSSEKFLKKLESRFGSKAVENVLDSLKVKLRRKLVEEMQCDEKQ